MSVSIRMLCVGIMATALLPIPARADIPRQLPSSFPECGQIQQPRIIAAVATPSGAQFTWESRGTGAEFRIWINRYVNGAWVRDDGWGEAGGALGAFVPWIENGVVAEGVSLSVVQKCFGQAWGTPSSAWQRDIPKPTPAATVTVTPTPESPNKLECVNRKTAEVKTYALKKCPAGWKRFA